MAGQQVLESQPFSVLLKARLATLSEGEAVLEVPVRNELVQQNGFVHGGVISYLADNALTFAGGSVLGPAVLTKRACRGLPDRPLGQRCQPRFSWRSRSSLAPHKRSAGQPPA